jgi:alpha-1,6-mannosyltransferase
MKIVQLANFHGPGSGGIRTFVEEVGRRYGDAGHSRVLVVPGGRDADESIHAGRRISLRSPVLPFDRGYRVLVAGRRLLAVLDELRPDALEVSDRLLLIRVSDWARSRGIPVLLFSHERLDAALRDRVPARVPLVAASDLVNRRLAGRADRVAVGSEFAAAEFRRIGASPAVVRLGVDLATFRPLATPRPGAGRTVQLALISPLSREKRPELALAALRVLRMRGVPASLLVLGDGPLRRKLERAATGLPVRFLGHVADRRCLPHLIGSADITIASAPMETFGLAVLESLACGTPVVVPAAGAARELISPGGGVVTSGTAFGLADGVESLLAIPAGHRRAVARARAEQFPWSATVAGMLAAHGAVTPAERFTIGPLTFSW